MRTETTATCTMCGITEDWRHPSEINSIDAIERSGWLVEQDELGDAQYFCPECLADEETMSQLYPDQEAWRTRYLDEMEQGCHRHGVRLEEVGTDLLYQGGGVVAGML